LSEWYPLLLQVKGRRCFVAGGGRVAERKVGGLLEAGASVEVAALSFTERLLGWAGDGKIRLFEREAEDADVEGALLVFAATDDPGTNRNLVRAAMARGIPANAADEGDVGTFQVPAVLRRGDFILAASTSGASPALSSKIMDDLATRYPPEFGEYVKALRSVRESVKAAVADPGERAVLLKYAATDEMFEEWSRSAWPTENERLIEWLRQRAIGVERLGQA
jgi:precorrin-2 dehydrogenase / sirohydrochlorin ferrochelatase